MNISIKIFFACITILFTISLSAQTPLRDVIYLKNGGIIHGVIWEQIPEKEIKIETSDKNIFVYKLEEIEKIIKEEIEPTVTVQNEIKENIKRKLTGYAINFDFGLSAGGGKALPNLSASENIINFNVTNGYFINRSFFLGLRTGIQHYTSGYIFIPLSCNFIFQFTDGEKFIPFMSNNIGYSLSLMKVNIGQNENNPTGGINIESIIGAKIFITEKTALNFGIGYGFQKSDLNVTYRFENFIQVQPGDPFINSSVEKQFHFNYHFFTIKAGIWF